MDSTSQRVTSDELPPSIEVGGGRRVWYDFQHIKEMLCAKRKSDGQVEIARLEARPFAPFCCPECDSEVILRVSSVRLSNFAHKPPVTCEYGKGESEVHLEEGTENSRIPF